MDYSFIIHLISIHNGVTRRNREDYVLHVLRVADMVHKAFNDESLARLAALHDALEVCSHVDETVLTHDFKLSESDIAVLNILTADEYESSEEHFQRVLASGNTRALIIKYFDCKDNSVFTYSDYTFTLDVLKKDPIKEVWKYKKRMAILKKCLAKNKITID